MVPVRSRDPFVGCRLWRLILCDVVLLIVASVREVAPLRKQALAETLKLSPGGEAPSSGIFPQLAPNVSVLPLSDDEQVTGGVPELDLLGLFRAEDSHLIQRVRNATQIVPHASRATPPRARSFEKPLPPLRVSLVSDTQFGYDNAQRHSDDWGDYCFQFDSCQSCSRDLHCGWCAVETTCYASAVRLMCSGDWTATSPVRVGECPPEPSEAVPLPAMELDTEPSRVPFTLDNIPGCEQQGFRLPGDCQKARLMRAGGEPASSIKWQPDSIDHNGVSPREHNLKNKNLLRAQRHQVKVLPAGGSTAFTKRGASSTRNTEGACATLFYLYRQLLVMSVGSRPNSLSH
eukprot:INCI9723.2.p1 GENE.INCI9723.2~~INCI9723.2.p1  ORF type:complete len:346 (-),score=35.63 INCI9723.2:314-1351(-)